ncbi:MAG: geranylgeranylglyceryl/heptaprenylglyceryl phosphate synthase [Bacteroidia bacterium]|nr:geranylgeranylglyceryl/heptaprenylglyceryl phosphate synthase [Bacteroidia bacterium]
MSSNQNKNKKMISILIDPDKASEKQIDALIGHPDFINVDFIFVGGSLVTDGNMNNCIRLIKKRTNKPVVIFPGSPNQIDKQADGILLLSLISGRNSDLLIGRHVESSHKLKNSNLEILSTGYILVDGGRTTTVSYISNTTPIPQDKPGIAAATALAGCQLGYKLIYLDCGSGANNHASEKLIQSVRSEINVPLIVGGGIKTQFDAEKVFKAGADIVVVGNHLEKNPYFLSELVAAKNNC